MQTYNILIIAEQGIKRKKIEEILNEKKYLQARKLWFNMHYYIDIIGFDEVIMCIKDIVSYKDIMDRKFYTFTFKLWRR